MQEDMIMTVDILILINRHNTHIFNQNHLRPQKFL